MKIAIFTAELTTTIYAIHADGKATEVIVTIVGVFFVSKFNILFALPKKKNDITHAVQH